VDHRTVFRYTDRDITESSGLAVRGGLFFTVNDSGAGPVLYAVDPRSGDTVGTTTYSEGDVSDVEAVAPGPGGVVWVGDIGDNDADRPSVDVNRVPVRQPRGERALDADRYALVYPDGPHDAETLLVHPRTGRVYVVSKRIVGATVYAAPATLRRGTVNRLAPLGHVPGLVTDGAFFPDGKHIVLRSYGGAAVYTFPELREVGDLDLPRQEQGEAIAVDRTGAVFVGTEGVYTDVLEILLPAPLRAALDGDLPTALPSAEPRPANPVSEPTGEDEDWLWVTGGILLVALAGWLVLRASRPRSPHSR
ncbi:MAG TPA: hypothetical protein VFO98_02845, partial [Marmoricola sp.]|nr:hypothetical protein [Marmoricola sp.]